MPGERAGPVSLKTAEHRIARGAPFGGPWRGLEFAAIGVEDRKNQLAVIRYGERDAAKDRFVTARSLPSAVTGTIGGFAAPLGDFLARGNKSPASLVDFGVELRTETLQRRFEVFPEIGALRPAHLADPTVLQQGQQSAQPGQQAERQPGKQSPASGFHSSRLLLRGLYGGMSKPAAWRSSTRLRRWPRFTGTGRRRRREHRVPRTPPPLAGRIQIPPR